MEQLEQIVSLILIPILPSLAVLIGLYLQKLIQKAKAELQIAEDSQVSLRLDEAVHAVADAVLYTSQTYVDYMKDHEAFDQDAQKEALHMSITKAKLLMSAAAQKTVTDVAGDLDTWLKTMIEAQIKAMAQEVTPVVIPVPIAEPKINAVINTVDSAEVK